MYDVVDMAKKGISEEVLLSYIQQRQDTYDLSADDVRYLTDLGVPDKVVTEMLARPANVSEVALARSESGDAVRDYNQLDPVVNGRDADLSTFYTSLAPYGEWFNTEAYGYVWQPYPARANSAWAPYKDSGRWAYDNKSGWVWDSDYSWGWAPFHYGRWAYIPERKWVWVPGTTWAPAWVSWAHENDNYGWAPLPPEAEWSGDGFTYFGRNVGVDFNFGLGPQDYTFVPVNRFVYYDYAPYVLSPYAVGGFFSRTQFSAGIGFRGGGLFNAGFDFNFIDRHSDRHPRVMNIVNPGREFRSGYTDSNNMALWRPNIRNAASVTPETAIARANDRIARVEARREVRFARQEGRQTGQADLQQAQTLARERHQQAAKAAQEMHLAERANAQHQRVETQAANREQQQMLAQERAQSASERVEAARLKRQAQGEKSVEERQRLLSQAESRRQQAAQVREARTADRTPDRAPRPETVRRPINTSVDTPRRDATQQNMEFRRNEVQQRNAEQRRMTEDGAAQRAQQERETEARRAEDTRRDRAVQQQQTEIRQRDAASTREQLQQQRDQEASSRIQQQEARRSENEARQQQEASRERESAAVRDQAQQQRQQESAAREEQLQSSRRQSQEVRQQEAVQRNEVIQQRQEEAATRRESVQQQAVQQREAVQEHRQEAASERVQQRQEREAPREERRGNR